MKYKALILDHDDTAVSSTAEIHYPAHVAIMKKIRPGHPPVSIEQWLLKNSHPGISHYLTEDLGLNSKEMNLEFILWQEFVDSRIPHFFDGFIEMLNRFVSLGGKIAVVSHSTEKYILRDYQTRQAPLPEFIYGWEKTPEMRKPNPGPVYEILNQWKLPPEEVLIIDDLKPAVDMARSSGVPIAGAGWGHHIPEIRQWMKQNCDYYFDSIKELSRMLFQ